MFAPRAGRCGGRRWSRRRGKRQRDGVRRQRHRRAVHPVGVVKNGDVDAFDEEATASARHTAADIGEFPRRFVEPCIRRHRPPAPARHARPFRPQPIDVGVMHPEDGIERGRRDIRHGAVDRADGAADGDVDVVVRPLLDHAQLRVLAVENVARETGPADIGEERPRRHRRARFAHLVADVETARDERAFAIGMIKRIGHALRRIEEFVREYLREFAALRLRIIPIGQRQQRIARFFPQDAFEIVKIGAVPDQEVRRALAEMRTFVPEALRIDAGHTGIARQSVVIGRVVVGVDRRLEVPAFGIGRRPRLHRGYAFSQRRHLGGIAREARQRLPCWMGLRQRLCPGEHRPSAQSGRAAYKSSACLSHVAPHRPPNYAVQAAPCTAFLRAAPSLIFRVPIG